ncbi:hypothetical protein [Ktedonospora formicarum]|uniref:Uncharacterized protein n=1 Tax=Ktedonospora formicarum TaxID=2778364 RepID=A0A8J3IAX3_9CHLR|nr:hypothetical protein [Ktedonospora formicarum]GHO50528.1 hypothetical protein KSX_86910 [Ktedonospora formicarum]
MRQEQESEIFCGSDPSVSRTVVSDLSEGGGLQAAMWGETTLRFGA